MPCTTILVGKKASYNGSTIISRNDDGRFEVKKTIVVERNKAPRKYKSVLSKVEIDLPDFSYRYTAHPNVYTKDRGLWSACGINEYNVGMNATETITSNPLVNGGDPLVEYEKASKGKKEKAGGIGEEDLVTLVLPYIKTAREGVIRLAELIEKYGTYERNGLAFNDENEIWWFESIGGHHYVARRVPDDRMVIMPNQFGLDNFDFDDAFGAQKEHMCSKDLKEFIKENNLDLNLGNKFNPRLVFGSHTDQDHIYNTPRAWFLLKYFAPKSYKYEGCNADFTPLSDDIPWSFVPEHKVTIQEIKYVLGSYYQGTKYNPYGKEAEHGKYRSIGVPNTDVCGIEEIRKGLPAVEWASFGGGAFTCCFPTYTNVSKMPKFIGDYGMTVSTDSMYWMSRLIAAITDAHFAKAVIFTERYQQAVFNKSYVILKEYDAKYLANPSEKVLEEANEKIVKMVKEESEKTLESVMNVASNSMKIRYNREDN